jgi:magnesium-transporting ATPase (P-type)
LKYTTPKTLLTNRRQLGISTTISEWMMSKHLCPHCSDVPPNTSLFRKSSTAIRIEHYGFNELPEPARRSLFLRFTDQLTHFMALLLWVAGTLAFISGTPELGWAIWAVIWINAGFSFWQEFQAEQALAALNKMLPAQAKVYRDGTLCEIPVREMVPGDVMELEEGDLKSSSACAIASLPMPDWFQLNRCMSMSQC